MVRRPNSVICRARDKTLGDREVAVKFFLSRPEDNAAWVSQFEAEVAKLRSVSHRVLVPIVAGGCQDGWFYIVMELISGNTLYDTLKAGTQPDVDKAISIVTDLALGVKEIHEAGLVHGYIDSRGVLFKGEEVRLAGYCFSAVARVQADKTSEGKFLVEPAYISPEQVTGGTVDHRADIYALAVLLFELVAGKRPFAGDNPLQTAMLRLGKQPPSPAKINPAISPLLDAAIIKGLATDPAARYNSVSSFIEAIGSGGRQAGKGGDASAEAIGTQTIGVSMSLDSIRDMLKAHEQSKGAQQPPVDTGQTMIGQSLFPTGGTVQGSWTADNMQNPGSFIVLSGDRRGERFVLNKPQMMLGSDPACEISVPGKGVPPRYAIIIRREEKYFAGPLSANGLIVNGERIDTADDVPLKRGDVIEAGSWKLRFIEPKEVFTLDDAAAERAIDRQPPKTARILASAAAGLLVICMLLFWGYQRTLSRAAGEAATKAAKQEREKKTLITRLRAEGDELYKKGALVEPAEASARRRFEQVLDLDPEDIYAKKRVAEINERVRALSVQRERREQLNQQIAKLIEDGDRYFQAGNLISPPGNNAREAYQAVFRLDPNNQAATEKIALVERSLGEMVGRINEMLSKGREYQAAGQWVAPEGDNAYAMFTKVLAVDPGNAAAREAIYTMAAEAIIRGDRAKKAAQLADMQKAYVTAQALGVDPDYLAPRLAGIDLIKRSRANQIFVDVRTDAGKNKAAGGNYLDNEQLTRKLKAVQLQEDLAAADSGQRFYDMSGQKK